MPLAMIHFLDGAVDPGYGGGRPSGPSIDNTLPVPNPGPGLPGHLPSVPPGWPVVPAHPIAGLPGTRPDNSLPNPPPGTPGNMPDLPTGWPIIPAHPWLPLHGGGHLPRPDQGLPAGPPPVVPPGHTLILIRTADGKWHYAAIEPGQPVPNPLPEPTPEPKAY